MAALAATLMGCASDYDIQVRYRSDAPPEVQMDSQRLLIPKGIGVGVEIIPIEDDERIDAEVDMVPLRAGIIGIDLTLDDEVLFIYGVDEGSTEVDVYFDDERVLTLSAQVSQPIE
jgi:hypothetical protein